MIQSIIALIAIGLLIRMSFRANARFRKEVRLPMQWALDGSVNWTAPRGFALAMTPALASCSLSAIVAVTLFLTPRPGQEGGTSRSVRQITLSRTNGEHTGVLYACLPRRAGLA